MYQLPEPPAAPAAGQTQPTDADRDRIRRLFAALDEITSEQATAVRIEDPSVPSYEDGTQIGTAPPVPQPDSRIVPQWAAGLAVASIGVGAGSTGLGCAAWLLFKGLSMVSVPGLERFALIVIAPFAGLAMLATAVGCAVSKATRAVVPESEVHHHYNGTVHQDQRRQTSKNIGVWARGDNRQ